MAQRRGMFLLFPGIKKILDRPAPEGYAKTTEFSMSSVLSPAAVQYAAGASRCFFAYFYFTDACGRELR